MGQERVLGISGGDPKIKKCEVEREIGEKIEESVSEIGRLLREDDLMGAREITEKLKYYENIKNEIVRQK